MLYVNQAGSYVPTTASGPDLSSVIQAALSASAAVHGGGAAQVPNQAFSGQLSAANANILPPGSVNVIPVGNGFLVVPATGITRFPTEQGVPVNSSGQVENAARPHSQSQSASPSSSPDRLQQAHVPSTAILDSDQYPALGPWSVLRTDSQTQDESASASSPSDCASPQRASSDTGPPSSDTRTKPRIARGGIQPSATAITRGPMRPHSLSQQSSGGVGQHSTGSVSATRPSIVPPHARTSTRPKSPSLSLARPAAKYSESTSTQGSGSATTNPVSEDPRMARPNTHSVAHQASPLSRSDYIQSDAPTSAGDSSYGIAARAVNQNNVQEHPVLPMVPNAVSIAPVVGNVKARSRPVSLIPQPTRQRSRSANSGSNPMRDHVVNPPVSPASPLSNPFLTPKASPTTGEHPVVQPAFAAAASPLPDDSSVFTPNTQERDTLIGDRLEHVTVSISLALPSTSGSPPVCPDASGIQRTDVPGLTSSETSNEQTTGVPRLAAPTGNLHRRERRSNSLRAAAPPLPALLNPFAQTAPLASVTPQSMVVGESSSEQKQSIPPSHESQKLPDGVPESTTFDSPSTTDFPQISEHAAELFVHSDRLVDKQPLSEGSQPPGNRTPPRTPSGSAHSSVASATHAIMPLASQTGSPHSANTMLATSAQQLSTGRLSSSRDSQAVFALQDQNPPTNGVLLTVNVQNPSPSREGSSLAMNGQTGIGGSDVLGELGGHQALIRRVVLDGRNGSSTGLGAVSRTLSHRKSLSYDCGGGSMGNLGGENSAMPRTPTGLKPLRLFPLSNTLDFGTSPVKTDGALTVNAEEVSGSRDHSPKEDPLVCIDQLPPIAPSTSFAAFPRRQSGEEIVDNTQRGSSSNLSSSSSLSGRTYGHRKLRSEGSIRMHVVGVNSPGNFDMRPERGKGSSAGLKGPLSNQSGFDPALTDFVELDPKLVAIERSEYASMAWDSPSERRIKAPNIVAMTGQFNKQKLALWVTAEILESANLKRRMARMSHFITIAKCCMDFNDFHSAKAILGGLQSTPVWRLEKTWAGISRKDKSVLDKLAEALAPDSNYESLRKEIRKAIKQAHVPFLGVYLLDLIYLNEARKKEKVDRPGTGHETERESQITALIDELIRNAQNSKYDYEIIQPLQTLLTSDKYIEELRAMHEDTFYAMSYQLEPKETPNSSPSKVMDVEIENEDKKRLRTGLSDGNQPDIIPEPGSAVNGTSNMKASNSEHLPVTAQSEPTQNASIALTSEQKSRTVTGYFSMAARSTGGKGGNVGRDVLIDQRKWKTVNTGGNKKAKGVGYSTIEDDAADDMKFLDLVLAGDIVIPDKGDSQAEQRGHHAKDHSSSSSGSRSKTMGGASASRSRQSTDHASAGSAQLKDSAMGQSTIMDLEPWRTGPVGATPSLSRASNSAPETNNAVPSTPFVLPPALRTHLAVSVVDTNLDNLSPTTLYGMMSPTSPSTIGISDGTGSTTSNSPDSTVGEPSTPRVDTSNEMSPTHLRATSNVTSVKSEKSSIQGTVTKKDELDEEGRRAANRSWTKVALVLRGSALLMFRYKNKLHKSSSPNSITSAIVDLKHPIQIIDLSASSSVEIPADYTKRKNVFRVKPSGKAQVLFQVDDTRDLDRWMQAIRETIDEVQGIRNFNKRVHGMSATSKIAKIVLIPGDGIGPEVVAEGVRVLEEVSRLRKEKTGFEFQFETCLMGGCAIDATGNPLPPATLEACRSASAVLLGAVGGPQWPSKAHPGVRPEQGILALRKALDVYANVRPCKFPAKSLIEESPLKRSIVEGTDFVVVRELTGGIYFGEKHEGDENTPATDLMIYSAEEIRRITRIAAKLALLENPPLRVISVDKSNVLATSRLWKKVVTETITAEFPNVPLSHQLVDSCAMLMVKAPRELNGILLMENMFGDILSDESSIIPGSLGLMPSASLNGWGNQSVGVYEPIHGSAPDIAGKGIANPIGTILSVALLLRYSLGLEAEAAAVERGVAHVLDVQHLRTGDLGGKATTKEIGDAVVLAVGKELAALA
ncbi:3-isopropylmalate dehydrogenase [Gonapodya sp. JEL0774]|nr:3-isopropylmalate dehydrogenase [Gonapodya sp. JEL0774]